MLVDVVQLRREGVKLSAEAVKDAPRIRGRLQLTYQRPGDAGRAKRLPMAMLLRPESFDFALRPLDYARVTRISDQGLVIVGLQETKGFGRLRDELPQAWWCRPVDSSTSPS